MKPKRSILFVQNGDYAEAYRRFAEGGAETYRDQKNSVDFVAGLAPDARVTSFAFGAAGNRVELAPELWAMGGPREAFDASRISALLDETAATHLVLRTPHAGFLTEAARRKIPILPIFADIFSSKGLRGRYRSWKLRRALLQCHAPCFSNHSLNASRSLVEAIGLSPQKIIPWDWSKVPMAGKAKSGVGNSSRPTAFFAGTLSEDKGVGDCLDAISLLHADNIMLTMSFAGCGNISDWRMRAEGLGIADHVKFLGMISNAQVRAKMHEHDFVIVPSRHSYAEGLPNTIYEGLASRSVLVISDHPAFAGRLKADAECLIFPAMDSAALAACLKRAILDPVLYRQLSENSATAHDQLYIGMEWTALVTAFLDDPDNQTGWVEMNSLQALVQ
jgi:glycosyltransferase involved in cell wall biosynthesis